MWLLFVDRLVTHITHRYDFSYSAKEWGIPMKCFAIWFGVIIAGVATYILAEYTIVTLWINLEWRRPVFDWLIHIGLPAQVAAYWSLVWILFPSWITAFIAAIVIGRITRSGKWLTYTLLFFVGFIGYPSVDSISYVLRLAELDFSLAVHTAISLLLWDFVLVAIILLVSWRCNRTKKRTDDDVSATTAVKNSPTTVAAQN